jgi:hypothetical protein
MNEKHPEYHRHVSKLEIVKNLICEHKNERNAAKLPQSDA